MRRLFFLINSFLLRIKRGRKVKISNNSKINLGCGMTVHNDWRNVDGSFNALISKFPRFIIQIAYSLTGARKSFTKQDYVNILYENNFIHYDLRFGLPFHENMATHIYTSHFLEHLYPNEAELLLKDAYKVLKKGGVIRISVPDLEYAISLYPQEKKDMLNKYFFINNVNNTFSNHKFMYDYDSLSEILYSIGFQKVERSKFCSGDFPNIDTLDNRGTDSLFIEAFR